MDIFSFSVIKGAEKLLSKQSRGLDADSPAEAASQENPVMVEQLRRKVEELTSQNADLVLKVQVEFLTFKHILAECQQSSKSQACAHIYRALTSLSEFRCVFAAS